MGQIRVVVEGGSGKVSLKHGESLSCALLFTNPDGSIRSQAGATVKGVIYKAANRKWVWQATLGAGNYSTTVTRDGADITVPQLYLTPTEVQNVMPPADYTAEIWELRDSDIPASRYCGEFQITVSP